MSSPTLSSSSSSSSNSLTEIIKEIEPRNKTTRASSFNYFTLFLLETLILLVYAAEIKASSLLRLSPTTGGVLGHLKMALRGVWQLQKLIVSYCDWGGSSRGIRAFMESNLPTLKGSNPQLEVVTELIRGQHPHLKAFYRNSNERVVCVKNLTPEEIHLHATRLRNALGRKVVKLKTRHVTKHPSVQGAWTTDVKF